MTPSTTILNSPTLSQATRPVHRRGGSLSVTRLIVVAVAIAVSCQDLPVQAQIRDWTNTSNALSWYDFSPNWTPAGAPGPAGTALFQQAATYQVWWDSQTASTTPSVGLLRVLQGDVLFLNVNSGPQHQFTVNGTGNHDDFLIGNNAALEIRGLDVRSLGGVRMEFGASLTVDGSHEAGSTFTASSPNGIRSVGGDINVLAGGLLNCDQRLWMETGGQLKVSGSGSQCVVSGELLANSGGATLLAEAGGKIFSTTGGVGYLTNGNARITGIGSEWNNSGDLAVGYAASGQLLVDAGGRLTSGQGRIEDGEVRVTGNGSQWINSGDLTTGLPNSGLGGSLFVEAGGTVSSASGFLHRGGATVTGSGSQWSNSGNLQIGNASAGPGTPAAVLTVGTGGLVTVNGVTQLGETGSVNMDGGRFEFGQIAFSDFDRITGGGGSLAGSIANSGYAPVSSLTTSMSQNINVQDVRVVNSGTLYGEGTIRFGLNNTASGEVETSAGERMRFAGSGNTNAGEINNFGGQIRFDQYLTNQYGGIVAGRGQFIADGGWSNSGVMAFSGGFADIVGDVYNQEGATIVTSGNGTTTFYDDFAQENGGSVRTSAGSSTVFFGEVSGGGEFVGDGTVFLEGDLRPGNSPGTMSFGGDLVLSSSASTTIELGGLGLAEFDRILIGSDLFLGGSSLEVALWDGFVLGNDMQFLFADVEGGLFGQFSGLGEGSLVGNFGGTDLFITYNGFGGNGGVGLFTSAIPEPSALALVGIASVLGLASRRRRQV